MKAECSGRHLVFAVGCLQVDVLGFVRQRERHHRVLVLAVRAYLPVTGPFTFPLPRRRIIPPDTTTIWYHFISFHV